MKSPRDSGTAHARGKAHRPEQRLPSTAVSAAIDPDAWFTPGRFALIFGVLVVVCFPQVVFGFETFFFRDFV
ncbi:MAG TPA: hypothetical protein VN281_13100, partial [Verrucomicrobiae bacterium]|nr:hypothetical protein [Verrucomicrobiae bacterium]